jgi:FMN phosphatase YigB (HAD superfamily)
MTGRKVLVVDVDETLLTLEPLFFLQRFRKDYRNTEGRTVLLREAKHEYYIAPRPRLKEFLTEAKKHFRLAAFSVAGRDITLEKLKLLGLDAEFSRIYGEEDLVDRKKDIRKVADDFNVPLADVIAIDDKPEAFSEHRNIIKVRPWLIGSSKEYEFQQNEDNLLGAFARALAV